MAWRRVRQLAIALACVARAVTGIAADDCTHASDDCVRVGGWNFSVGLGAGVRTNPLVHTQDIPLVVIPQVSYYGRRFFLDNLDLGVTLAEGQSNTLSLIATPGYDRVFFYRSDLQNIFVSGVPFSSEVAGSPHTTHLPNGSLNAEFPSRPRHVTYLAGPEWTFDLGGVAGQLDYVHEITAQDHGDEVRGALAIPLGRLAGSWSMNAGFTWKSSAIVNYYYGAPGIYEGGSAFDPFVKLGYVRPLRGNWKLTGFVEYERLGNAIADSPIVAQHHVTTAFLGATYVFQK
jgi:MipA family protein